MNEPRKLGEIWQVGKNYQIRVMVGAFQRDLGLGNAEQAEAAATYEIIEVMRKILAAADDNDIDLLIDEPGQFRPPMSGFGV